MKMKWNRKWIAALLALCMLLALSACSNSNAGNGGNTGANGNAGSDGNTDANGDQNTPAFTTVEEGKLHMSTNAAFPPYEMTTDDGGFEGIDVEVAEAIAKKLGLELVVDDMDFTAALTAVQQGMSDMAMAGITIKPDREAVLDFSDFYSTGIQVIIVKEGSDVTLDTLGDYLIGVQTGTTGWDYCTGDYGDDHVKAFDNGITAVQALINDQVDCVVIDNGPAEEFVAANAGAGLTILDTEYAVEDYAIAVNKGNTALLDAINGALAELKADGTVQQIVDKYINAG